MCLFIDLLIIFQTPKKSIETQRLILSNISYWIDEFKFDGFRFDGIGSMIYNNFSLGNSERFYCHNIRIIYLLSLPKLKSILSYF